MNVPSSQRFTAWDIAGLAFVLFLCLQAIRGARAPRTQQEIDASRMPVLHATFVGADGRGLGSQVFYVRSDDGGSAWSKPTALSTGSEPKQAPELRTGPGQALEVTWLVSGRSHRSSVHSEDAGRTWSAPQERPGAEF